MHGFTVFCFLVVLGPCLAASLNGRKSLKVGCTSLGNGDDFSSRLKIRDNAVDQTTIWLFKGEQLTINFELDADAAVGILDVRYSNDGDSDEIGLSLDDEFVGKINTDGIFAWGRLWNMFYSSGPVGRLRYLKAGEHSLTVKILEADDYGVEIDYIRLNVQGAFLTKRKDFLCVHTPSY